MPNQWVGQDRSLSLTGTLRFAARPLPKSLANIMESIFTKIIRMEESAHVV